MLDRLMNASPQVRYAVFGVVGAVLVVLAVVAMTMTGDGRATDPTASPTVTATQPLATQPVSTASVTPSSGVTGGVPPLPASDTDINEASQIAATFVAKQNTYRYDQNDATWMADLTSLATDEEKTALSSATVPAQQRDDWNTQHLVAAATTSTSSIYVLAADSITFIVDYNQTVTTDAGQDTTNGNYLVTTTRSADSWLVSTVQGVNDGDHN